MKHIKLGNLDVARIGLGTMGMSAAYTGAGLDDAESIRTIHRAIELGVTLIDTAEIYGPFTNEELVGRAHQGQARPGRACDQVRLRSRTPAAARAHRQQPGEHPRRRRGLAQAARHRPHRPVLPAPGRPEHADRGHRRRAGRAGRRGQGPPHRPVRGLGRHHPARPRRPPDHRPAVRVLAVDPRPRGRGAAGAARARHRLRALLAARPRLPDREHPLRRRSSTTPTGAGHNPRFTGENFQHNLRLADEVEAIAAEVGATPAQVALAWLLAQGDDIAPIPGTKRVARVEENAAADAIELTRGAGQRLTTLPPAAGDHHTEAQMRMIDR